MLKKIFLIVILALSTAQGKEIFSKYNVSIGNGKHIWISLYEDNDGCYDLMIGGDRSGSGVRCGNINGYWSVTACDRTGHVNGGITEAINKMLELCQ